MGHEHHYALDMEWTGNTGQGTRGYENYSRSHVIRAKGKPDLVASADPTFRGDVTQYNPEELLVAALSGCHLLTYLALCARARIVVIAYFDKATGSMRTTPDGGGHMTEVVLHPEVTVAEEAMIPKALELHGAAHKYCFIANSVNFPVLHQPVVRAAN